MPSMTLKGNTRLSTAQPLIGADQNTIPGLMTTPGMPEYAGTGLRGDGWTVGTASPLTPLTAVPTTTAAVELYNNGSRIMMVQELYAFQLLSTAATQTYSLWAMITTQKAVPTLSALSLFSTSGKNLITPTASGEAVTGVGTTVVANGWRPWGVVQAWGTAAALVGNGWSVPVNGKLLVPPRCSVCLHLVGTVATASSFHIGLTFDWYSGTVEA